MEILVRSAIRSKRLSLAWILLGCFSLMAQENKAGGAEARKWFPFNPKADAFAENCAIDLRSLNEKFAGEHGYIGVTNGEFIHTATGLPLRFWGVNGPPGELKGSALKACARLLAKRGVNLVRIHGGYFDENGEVVPAKIQHTLEIIDAMKAEGIYSHLSIYFPLWITPKANAAWLPGYDGKKHPFAALFFNPDFQTQYRKWWTALLTTPNPATGKTLAQEPAVAALEMQNEDSLFFWTFSEQNIPDVELKILERLFGDWLVKKYGSLSAAFAKWDGLKIKRDDESDGRAGFRPLWAIFNEKTSRDKDTARFLFELQTRFYSETHAFLRKLGFKAPITASNWATASPEVFGPLEKLSYNPGDFIDRHGYFSCNHKGENAEWSIRNGHTYSDRSGYRFDPEVPGKPKLFVHPAMDPHYDDKPSMISETTWTRPNRYRGEAPIYLAAYGALQHSDAIIHFAFDGMNWAVKPNYWMQPWTLMSPTMMGQFPAAAFMFRKGLISEGKLLAQINLNTNDLLQLKGTPLPQDAALDELRLKDIPSGETLKPGGRVDPLLHYAGRSQVNFVGSPGSVKLSDLGPFVDHARQTVRSSTGELSLDYGRGVLRIDAAQAQGVSGCLGAVGSFETKDLAIVSDMEVGHIIAVSLDNQPLSTSAKILLQIMSEEQASGFATEPVDREVRRIVNIGSDPWQTREVRGKVQFRRPDASLLKVTALDANGYPERPIGSAETVQLEPATLYYLITK